MILSKEQIKEKRKISKIVTNSSDFLRDIKLKRVLGNV